MARSLRAPLLFAVTLICAVALPAAMSPARAAELDKKGKADAKEAMRFYKEGNYEDAAKVFARLSVNYPDTLVFVRNLGACYYHLRRWEPAISNLRDYEHRKKDIADDDRAEISGWIGEMERLRDQASRHPFASASAPALAPSTQAAAPPVAPEPVGGSVVAGRAVATVAPPESAHAAATPPAPAPPAATDGATPVPATPALAPPAPATPVGGTTPSPEAGATPAAEQPQAYPPAQWGAQSTYPPGPYGYQPGYPPAQSPYGSPSGAAYPASPGYPQGYPPGAYAPAPAGQAAAAAGPGSGRKVAAWILGLTGVAAVGAGAICTFKALDDFSKVEKRYDPALEDEGKQFAVAQWVGYGVGGALLATALIVGASGGSSSSGVALAPAAGPGTAGATLAGTF
jgi:hypothetical protein